VLQSHSLLVASDIGALDKTLGLPLDPTDTFINNCLHLVLDLAIALAESLTVFTFYCEGTHPRAIFLS